MWLDKQAKVGLEENSGSQDWEFTPRTQEGGLFLLVSGTLDENVLGPELLKQAFVIDFID